ncbi:hypothetical protein GGI13_004843 [Coemansia sp. RSA 455]|nr:hypothetical protein GGI13_004843 [Coemansia sp. RSA 455]
MSISSNTQYFVTGHHAKRKFCDVDAVYKRRRIGLGVDGIGAAVNVVRVPLPPMAWAYIRAQPWPKGQTSTLAARRARRRSPHLPGGGIRPVRRLSPGYRATLRTLRYNGAVVGVYPADQFTFGGAAPPVNYTAYRLPSKTRAPSTGVKRARQTPSFIARRLQKVAVVKQRNPVDRFKITKIAVPIRTRQSLKGQYRSLATRHDLGRLGLGLYRANGVSIRQRITNSAGVVRLRGGMTLRDNRLRRRRRTSFVNEIRVRQRQRARKELRASQQLRKYPATTPAISVIPATPPAIPNGGGATGWFPVGWDFVSWRPAGQLPAGWSFGAQDTGAANIARTPAQPLTATDFGAGTAFPAPLAVAAKGANNSESDSESNSERLDHYSPDAPVSDDAQDAADNEYNPYAPKYGDTQDTADGEYDPYAPEYGAAQNAKDDEYDPQCPTYGSGPDSEGGEYRNVPHDSRPAYDVSDNEQTSDSDSEESIGHAAQQSSTFLRSSPQYLWLSCRRIHRYPGQPHDAPDTAGIDKSYYALIDLAARNAGDNHDNIRVAMGELYNMDDEAIVERYRQMHELGEYVPGVPVLHGISLSAEHGEKIGVVGRTGAGKSTMSLAFLRFIEAAQGRILLDNVDIAKIGLEELRRNVTIIPQDPVLFNGTIRFNLDPFGEYPDELVWDTLKRAHLVRERGSQTTSTATSVYDGGDNTNEAGMERMSGIFTGLDAEIKENGQNLSLGQRQLVALARALVRRSRLIIMDEATASVDFDTDDRIQRTIRGTEFANSTLFCIAHRLRTIIDYDRVLVLDKGKVAEFDTPWNMLQREGGIFRSMCEKSGEYEHLVAAARHKSQLATASAAIH